MRLRNGGLSLRSESTLRVASPQTYFVYQMESAIKTFRKIESYERELIDPQIQKDLLRIRESLSNEFVEFGSSGKIIRKADVLESISDSGTTAYLLSDFKFKMLGDTYILVTYRSITVPSQKAAHRSSIWVNEKGRWQMLHHQATVIPNKKIG